MQKKRKNVHVKEYPKYIAMNEGRAVFKVVRCGLTCLGKIFDALMVECCTSNVVMCMAGNV